MDPVELAANASGLLAEVGVPVILKTRRRTEHDVSTSTVEGGERSFETIGFPYDFNFRDIDGVMILQGDVRVLMSVKQSNGTPLPEPKAEDRVYFDGAHWTVLASKPIKVKGQAVVYEVHARK